MERFGSAVISHEYAISLETLTGDLCPVMRRLTRSWCTGPVRLPKHHPTMQNKSIRILTASEGKHYHFAGVDVRIKARRSETEREWAFMEYSAPPGFSGPAPHFHKIMEEGFYVLEGTLSFQLDGKWIAAGPGTFVHVPAYTVHAFRNFSEEPVRFLVWMSPGGFEGYYDELMVMMEKEPFWPPSDTGLLNQLLEKYDTYPPAGE